MMPIGWDAMRQDWGSPDLMPQFAASSQAIAARLPCHTLALYHYSDSRLSVLLSAVKLPTYSLIVIPYSFLKHLDKYFDVLNPTFSDSSVMVMFGFCFI